MIETVFQSEDLPAADRFGYVRELMALAPVPMEASSDHTDGFRVLQRDLHLDSVRVWRMAFQPMTFHRTPKLIRRSDPETYNVCLLLDGAMGLKWDRGEATYGLYDLHINDSSRPFDLAAGGTDGLISCVGVEIPRRLLDLPPDRADRMIGRPMSGREGMGALLAQFLTGLSDDPASYRPTDGPRLGLVATDLVSALIAHHLDDDRDLPPETRRRTLIMRIRAFIQQHLDDPHLTPSVIADAHNISLSYLHRLFQDEQYTVAAWIRHQRMESARRDLADRALHPTPIHAIAARWGFPRAADFTRAFRTTYGIAPTDYRRRTLQVLE